MVNLCQMPKDFRFSFRTSRTTAVRASIGKYLLRTYTVIRRCTVRPRRKKFQSNSFVLYRVKRTTLVAMSSSRVPRALYLSSLKVFNGLAKKGRVQEEKRVKCWQPCASKFAASFSVRTACWTMRLFFKGAAPLERGWHRTHKSDC